MSSNAVKIEISGDTNSVGAEVLEILELSKIRDAFERTSN